MSASSSGSPFQDSKGGTARSPLQTLSANERLFKQCTDSDGELDFYMQNDMEAAKLLQEKLGSSSVVFLLVDTPCPKGVNSVHRLPSKWKFHFAITLFGYKLRVVLGTHTPEAARCTVHLRNALNIAHRAAKVQHQMKKLDAFASRSRNPGIHDWLGTPGLEAIRN